jgi:hypothetical protein
MKSFHSIQGHSPQQFMVLVHSVTLTLRILSRRSPEMILRVLVRQSCLYYWIQTWSNCSKTRRLDQLLLSVALVIYTDTSGSRVEASDHPSLTPPHLSVFSVPSLSTTCTRALSLVPLQFAVIVRVYTLKELRPFIFSVHRSIGLAKTPSSLKATGMNCCVRVSKSFLHSRSCLTVAVRFTLCSFPTTMQVLHASLLSQTNRGENGFPASKSHWRDFVLV